MQTKIKQREGRRRRAFAPASAALVIAAMLILSACGSSGSSSSSSTSAGTTGGSSEETTSSSGGALTAKDISVANEYVKGGSGKATKSPIKVGLVVSNTGPTGQPYLVQASENAISLVNEKLGGIEGHPIELELCDFGASAQQGQNCGSQFANDPSVKAVLYTGGTTGEQQLLAANGGKKTYFCTVASPTSGNEKNLFCTTGGPLSTGAIGTYLSEFVEAKKVSILTIEDPTLESFVAEQKKAFAEIGITATTGVVPSGATDVTSALVASGAQSADAVVFESPLANICPAFAKAAQTLSITAPIVSLAACETPSVEEALGDLPEWTYFNWGPNINIPDPSGQVQVFLDANKEFGEEATGVNAVGAFGTALLMARTMNELGPENLTTSALSAKMAAYKGGLFLGDPKLKFGSPPFTSVGSITARFFTYEGNGKWKDDTEGEYVAAPGA